MIPTEKQIEEIAENLECGMRYFYNIRTADPSAANDRTTLHGNHNKIIFVS